MGLLGQSFNYAASSAAQLKRFVILWLTESCNFCTFETSLDLELHQMLLFTLIMLSKFQETYLPKLQLFSESLWFLMLRLSWVIMENDHIMSFRAWVESLGRRLNASLSMKLESIAACCVFFNQRFLQSSFLKTIFLKLKRQETPKDVLKVTQE